MPRQGIKASFPRGGVTGVIRVDVIDTLPLRGAVLVAPDGSTTAANWLDVAANQRTLGGQESIGDSWRSSILANNGLNPLPNGTRDPAPIARDRILLTMSTADISVPDPVVYRRDWAGYKIRLSFAGAGNELDVRDIPAPAPPAEERGG
jgi:hypothetical protein